MKDSAVSENKQDGGSVLKIEEISRPVKSGQDDKINPLAGIIARSGCNGRGCSRSLSSLARWIAEAPGAQRKTIGNSLQRSLGNRFVQDLAVRRLQSENDMATFEQDSTLKAEVGSLPNRTGMPDNLKSGVESLSGMDLSDVRVHYNSADPARINALAYTQGHEIHVAPGQERHLPHEAWHVVQQAQGRVKPTMQLTSGVSINDDQGLEHEADEMGERAEHTWNEEDKIVQDTAIASSSIHSPVMQFKGWKFFEFIDRLMSVGINGMCDALSAAWLADLIEPDTDDTMGVDDTNFKKITLIRNLFRWIANYYLSDNIGSKDLTFVFVDWFREKKLGSRWFEELTEENIEQDEREFKDYIKKYNWESKRNQIKTDNITKKYNELTPEVIFTLIDNMLEHYFYISTPFHGIITINAYLIKDFGSLNHQMAIRYNPGGCIFSLFDQNGGLTRTGIDEQEDIADIIAGYLHRGYVTNPMKTDDDTTDSANIEIWIEFGN